MKKHLIIVMILAVILLLGCVQTTITTMNVRYQKLDTHLITSDHVVLAANYYQPDKAGTFPLIILIHQFDGTREQWNNFIPMLIAHNYSVITYDIRGLGNSTMMDDGRSFDADENYFNKMPLDVKAAIDYAFYSNNTRIDKNHIGVIGASVGGKIAYVASSEYPIIKTTVSLSPAYRYMVQENSSTFNPQSIFFLSDEREIGDVQPLFDRTAEPKQIKVYEGAGHGIAILSNKDALNDIWTWLDAHL